MKFGSILNILAFTGLSGLLASPINSDSYPESTSSPLPNPPALNPADYHQVNQEDSNSYDNSGIPCQKDLENHYHQGDEYHDNNNENYSSTAKIDPYYIWSPRPRWGRHSPLNRRDVEPSNAVSPYYIWSPRPKWGRYSAQNEIDVQAPSNDVSPYYVWSPRPKWGRYSTDANVKTNDHYPQKNGASYSHPVSQEPAKYSSGQHVQLHG
jgi:hypothetical protein